MILSVLSSLILILDSVSVVLCKLIGVLNGISVEHFYEKCSTDIIFNTLINLHKTTDTESSISINDERTDKSI